MCYFIIEFKCGWLPPKMKSGTKEQPFYKTCVLIIDYIFTILERISKSPQRASIHGRPTFLKAKKGMVYLICSLVR